MLDLTRGARLQTYREGGQSRSSRSADMTFVYGNAWDGVQSAWLSSVQPSRRRSRQANRK